MSELRSGVDLYHYKLSAQVRGEGETIWSKDDLQQYAAFTMLLQLLEFSSCNRDQNLPVLFQYIDFIPSQFVKVIPNLLCHFFSVEAISRIVLFQCLSKPWSHLTFTGVNRNMTAVIRAPT